MNSPILSCLTCAKNFADHGANAAGYSILFLLIVIVAMLGSIGFFMVRLARRSGREEALEMRDEFGDFPTS
jgi:hypothetical protein